MSNVETKVKEIVAEQLGINKVELENANSFVEDLGADSLDIVELIMRFEEAFELEIPDEDAEHISVIQDAIKYLKGRVEPE